MKRALAMALGAMLVAGSAVPAAAKSQVDFNGMYRTYAYGTWNTAFTREKDDQGVRNDDFDSDFFLADRLQLDFGFHATDEVSVYWRLRAPAAKRWGDNSGTGVVSRYYYGQIKQDWGTLSLGRLKDSFADVGLASLGYAPDGPDVNATGVLPFDLDTPASAIHYLNRTDGGFQLAAAIFRLKTKQYGHEFKNWEDIDVIDTSGNPGTMSVAYEDYEAGLHDETADFFVLEPAFLWDGGGASFGIHFTRDHVTLGTDSPAYKEYAINPAFIQSFGDMSVHFEGKAGWGKTPAADGQEDKSSGYALYLDGDYNYGPGNITLAGWWAAGPDTKANEEGGGKKKTKGTVGMGSAFAPLIVAYGSNGSPVEWYSPYGSGGVTAIQLANVRSAPLTEGSEKAQWDANHWALDLNGAHAISDDMTFTYALAYLSLNKVRQAEGTETKARKKLIGYEADLGLQVQLLDNLHFGTTLGYLKAGDALMEPGSDKKPDDSYSWFNTLTFSF